MTKSRLEAFSDGVFAIVITLLILDIRLPEVDYAHLPEALSEAAPKLVAYVMSFVVIGLYWVSHHHSFHRLARIDGVLLWLNILLLLFVSFLPFPTMLLGRYPLQTLPVVLYGLNLIAANATGFVMLWYASRRPELVLPKLRASVFRDQWPVYAVVNAAYFAAIAVSPFWPIASYVIYVLVVIGVMLMTTVNAPETADAVASAPEA